MSIDGYNRMIRMNVPVLAFSDAFVRLLDILFAPIHYIVGLQIKVSLDSLSAEFCCVNFFCIYCFVHDKNETLPGAKVVK